MRELLLVATFGAAGAASRYGVGVLMQKLFGEGFVFGTIVVNLLGCFLLGFLWHVTEVRQIMKPPLSAAVGIGFLGALTTFSTFGLETILCLQRGRYLLAGVNVAANLLVGLLLVWAGITLARQILGQ